MDAYESALNYLKRREHTEKELFMKLSKKGYSRDEISEAVKKLQEFNYQSDRRFAESYLRSRLARSPEGRSVLLMRLISKGVSKSLAAEVVDEYFDEHEEEINEIFSEYQKKLEDRKGEDKARSTLIRKGIRKVEY
ncbi:MAG: recombination regulator RecX [Sphaerochaetaceae bacterium]|nr:recombination regulator RecX [Sphaerochaetaceae bacterium]